MFNDTFYPTPPALVDILVGPLNLDGKHYVLEPSAGKGDILDRIVQHAERTYGYNRVQPPKMYAVELQPELRAVLTDKGYPVVADDFLTYWPAMNYDYIVMNPPWNRAEDHLLHAWEILTQGEIACIYPASGLEGKDAKERRVLDLIQDHGSVEHLGAAFANGAERRTDAHAAIVRLVKKAIPTDGLDFDVRNDRIDPDFSEFTGNELTLNSFVGDLLASYNATLAAYADYNMARQRVQRYLAPLNSHHNIQDRGGRSITVMEAADAHANPRDRWNSLVENVTASAWEHILGHPSFQNILTERARRMFDEFRRNQRRIDFNEDNIRAMFGALVARQDELLKAVVLDAFDTMTEHYPENRQHFEGWMSNDAWKVNKRVVMPYAVRLQYDGKHFDTEWSRQNKLVDIDRAICVVTGIPFDNIDTIAHAIKRATTYDNCHESSFFKVRCFKKGTAHLWWLDEEVRKQFNIAAAQARGWLPPGAYDGTF